MNICKPKHSQVQWTLYYCRAGSIKISVRYKSLLLAFLFVGIFDMVFYKNLLESNFFKGSQEELLLKSVLFIILSVVLGAIDVICAMVPISELAAFIGKRSEKFVGNRIYVIMMKSYAISHLIFLIPYSVYVYSGIGWENIDFGSFSNKAYLLYSDCIYYYIALCSA